MEGGGFWLNGLNGVLVKTGLLGHAHEQVLVEKDPRGA